MCSAGRARRVGSFCLVVGDSVRDSESLLLLDVATLNRIRVGRLGYVATFHYGTIGRRLTVRYKLQVPSMTRAGSFTVRFATLFKCYRHKNVTVITVVDNDLCIPYS